MRLRVFFTLACGWGLGLAALALMPADSAAQEVAVPVVPVVNPGPYPVAHGWGFWHCRPVFPRTFSYQYDIWFNRPQHTRVVGPDGHSYWQATVRGLPLGAPWPPY
jgi:hypothetical protein